MSVDQNSNVPCNTHLRSTISAWLWFHAQTQWAALQQICICLIWPYICPRNDLLCVE